MKKLTILLVLSSALTATPSFAAGGSATPPGQSRFIEFCKNDTAGSPFTLGDCVSYVSALLTNSQGYAAQDCDFWRTLDPDTFNGAYDSYDECVRDGASQLPF